MTLINPLIPIIALDRESAVAELSSFKQTSTASKYKMLIGTLSKCQQATLVDINASEVNRRRLTSWEGFSLGDSVTTCAYASLIGVELTVVEFIEPWVCCIFPSGSSTPGLLPEDLCIVPKV
jgi:hypothetical protein